MQGDKYLIAVHAIFFAIFFFYLIVWKCTQSHQRYFLLEKHYQALIISNTMFYSGSIILHYKKTIDDH